MIKLEQRRVKSECAIVASKAAFQYVRDTYSKYPKNPSPQVYLVLVFVNNSMY